MNLQTRTIAVIGLGYVGLPLGAGEEEVTDRQRPPSVRGPATTNPSLRGPSGPVAINADEPMIFIFREVRSIGEGRRETDRQRHPSLRGPSGPVAINCALPQCKRITAQQGFAAGVDCHVAPAVLLALTN